MGDGGWDPHGYPADIRKEIERYDELQERVVAASAGVDVATILELGTGTGETARLLLKLHRFARLVGLDGSGEMLAAARETLPADRVELRVGLLEDELPAGRFELVVSALAVHHLTADAKVALFRRIAKVLAPGGRFVLGDVVSPERSQDAVIPLEEGFDLPDTVEDQLAWLTEAGLEADLLWCVQDLAVLCADRPT